jgi:hypothetical protein
MARDLPSTRLACYAVIVRAFSVALVCALLMLAVASPVARADLEGAEFFSPEWRVRLTAPKYWQLSERSSYPSVLLWMSRRAPRGKMLFAAERLPAPETARAYAARTAKKLSALGFRVRAPQLHSASGAYWFDFENDKSYLRQAFLVAGPVGFTLTLSADDPRTRSQHLRAFDSALRSITPQKDTPVTPEGAPEPEVGPAKSPGAEPPTDGSPPPTDGAPPPVDDE